MLDFLHVLKQHHKVHICDRRTKRYKLQFFFVNRGAKIWETPPKMLLKNIKTSRILHTGSYHHPSWRPRLPSWEPLLWKIRANTMTFSIKGVSTTNVSLIKRNSRNIYHNLSYAAPCLYIPEVKHLFVWPWGHGEICHCAHFCLSTSTFTVTWLGSLSHCHSHSVNHCLECARTSWLNYSHTHTQTHAHTTYSFSPANIVT